MESTTIGISPLLMTKYCSSDMLHSKKYCTNSARIALLFFLFEKVTLCVRHVLITARSLQGLLLLRGWLLWEMFVKWYITSCEVPQSSVCMSLLWPIYHWSMAYLMIYISLCCLFAWSHFGVKPILVCPIWEIKVTVC